MVKDGEISQTKASSKFRVISAGKMAASPHSTGLVAAENSVKTPADMSRKATAGLTKTCSNTNGGIQSSTTALGNSTNKPQISQQSEAAYNGAAKPTGVYGTGTQYTTLETIQKTIIATSNGSSKHPAAKRRMLQEQNVTKEDASLNAHKTGKVPKTITLDYSKAKIKQIFVRGENTTTTTTTKDKEQRIKPPESEAVVPSLTPAASTTLSAIVQPNTNNGSNLYSNLRSQCPATGKDGKRTFHARNQSAKGRPNKWAPVVKNPVQVHHGPRMRKLERVPVDKSKLPCVYQTLSIIAARRKTIAARRKQMARQRLQATLATTEKGEKNQVVTTTQGTQSNATVTQTETVGSRQDHMEDTTQPASTTSKSPHNTNTPKHGNVNVFVRLRRMQAIDRLAQCHLLGKPSAVYYTRMTLDRHAKHNGKAYSNMDSETESEHADGKPNDGVTPEELPLKVVGRRHRWSDSTMLYDPNEDSDNESSTSGSIQIYTMDDTPVCVSLDQSEDESTTEQQSNQHVIQPIMVVTKEIDASPTKLSGNPSPHLTITDVRSGDPEEFNSTSESHDCAHPSSVDSEVWQFEVDTTAWKEIIIDIMMKSELQESLVTEEFELCLDEDCVELDYCEDPHVYPAYGQLIQGSNPTDGSGAESRECSNTSAESCNDFITFSCKEYKKYARRIVNIDYLGHFLNMPIERMSRHYRKRVDNHDEGKQKQSAFVADSEANIQTISCDGEISMATTTCKQLESKRMPSETPLTNKDIPKRAATFTITKLGVKDFNLGGNFVPTQTPPNDTSITWRFMRKPEQSVTQKSIEDKSQANCTSVHEESIIGNKIKPTKNTTKAQSNLTNNAHKLSTTREAKQDFVCRLNNDLAIQDSEQCSLPQSSLSNETNATEHIATESDKTLMANVITETSHPYQDELFVENSVQPPVEMISLTQVSDAQNDSELIELKGIDTISDSVSHMTANTSSPASVHCHSITSPKKHDDNTIPDKQVCGGTTPTFEHKLKEVVVKLYRTPESLVKTRAKSLEDDPLNCNAPFETDDDVCDPKNNIEETDNKCSHEITESRMIEITKNRMEVGSSAPVALLPEACDNPPEVDSNSTDMLLGPKWECENQKVQDEVQDCQRGTKTDKQFQCMKHHKKSFIGKYGKKHRILTDHKFTENHIGASITGEDVMQCSKNIYGSETGQNNVLTTSDMQETEMVAVDQTTTEDLPARTTIAYINREQVEPGDVYEFESVSPASALDSPSTNTFTTAVTVTESGQADMEWLNNSHTNTTDSTYSNENNTALLENLALENEPSKTDESQQPALIDHDRDALNSHIRPEQASEPRRHVVEAQTYPFINPDVPRRPVQVPTTVYKRKPYLPLLQSKFTKSLKPNDSGRPWSSPPTAFEVAGNCAYDQPTEAFTKPSAPHISYDHPRVFDHTFALNDASNFPYEFQTPANASPIVNVGSFLAPKTIPLSISAPQVNPLSDILASSLNPNDYVLMRKADLLKLHSNLNKDFNIVPTSYMVPGYSHLNALSQEHAQHINTTVPVMSDGETTILQVPGMMSARYVPGNAGMYTDQSSSSLFGQYDAGLPRVPQPFSVPHSPESDCHDGLAAQSVLMQPNMELSSRDLDHLGSRVEEEATLNDLLYPGPIQTIRRPRIRSVTGGGIVTKIPAIDINTSVSNTTEIKVLPRVQRKRRYCMNRKSRKRKIVKVEITEPAITCVERQATPTENSTWYIPRKKRQCTAPLDLIKDRKADDLLEELIHRHYLHKCVCGVYFDDRLVYLEHKKCHTKNDPFRCSGCGRKFPCWDSFFDHFKTKHKKPIPQGTKNDPS